MSGGTFLLIFIPERVLFERGEGFILQDADAAVLNEERTPGKTYQIIDYKPEKEIETCFHIEQLS